MKRADIMAYINLLKDVLKPLKTLSVAFQSNDTTLADVREKLEVAKAVLGTYKVTGKNKLDVTFYSDAPFVIL